MPAFIVPNICTLPDEDIKGMLADYNFDPNQRVASLKVNAPLVYWCVLYSNMGFDVIERIILHPRFNPNATVAILVGETMACMPLIEAGINAEFWTRTRWFQFIDMLLLCRDVNILASSALLYMALPECSTDLIERIVQHPTLHLTASQIGFAIELSVFSGTDKLNNACMDIMANCGLDLSTMYKGSTLSDMALENTSSATFMEMVQILRHGGHNFVVTCDTLAKVIDRHYNSKDLFMFIMCLMQFTDHKTSCKTVQVRQMPTMKRIDTALDLFGYKMEIVIK